MPRIFIAVLLFLLAPAMAQTPALPFSDAFLKTLARRQVKLSPQDELGIRIVGDYGAIYAAADFLPVYPDYIFPDEASVKAWQAKSDPADGLVRRRRVMLQRPALKALQAAEAEARKQGLRITPRGELPARRSFAHTQAYWHSRVEPGLRHWLKQGRLTQQEANAIRKLRGVEQIKAVLTLEAKGLWFSQDLKKSILYSVAAPGTSQHLYMLAFDVGEHDDPRVRAILAKHGWYQTVYSDLPHFTYLGLSESELPARGLVARKLGDRTFWVPARRDSIPN